MNLETYRLRQAGCAKQDLDRLLRIAMDNGSVVVSVVPRTGGYIVAACDHMVPESVLKAFIAGTRLSVTFRNGVELNPPDNCEPITL